MPKVRLADAPGPVFVPGHLVAYCISGQLLLNSTRLLLEWTGGSRHCPNLQR